MLGKTEGREGLLVTISLGGIVVQFTFISYLDCSYYTTEERETFGKENYLSLWRELRLTNTFTYCNLQGVQKVESPPGIKRMYLPTWS